MDRWTADEVLAVAPDPRVAVAARALAVPSAWSATGCAGGVVWGRYHGPSAEPYQVVADLDAPGWRCSCPSRKVPCKHAVALLLLWVAGFVPEAGRPAAVEAWLAGRANHQPRPRTESVHGAPGGAPAGTGPARVGVAAPRDRRVDVREERVRAGLAELDRWLTDQVRGGLAADHLVRPATWNHVAARLVDAQAGSLANRVRRVGARVGVGGRWHERLLEELALLHVVATAGRRIGSLPPDVAVSVRQAVGWSAAQAEVRASLPVTDRWHVAGRSLTQEDRIVVRRTWLWGGATGEWAVLLHFAAHEAGLEPGPEVGTSFVADLHRYPGALPLRALVGHVHEAAVADEVGPRPSSIAEAFDAYGRALAAEPWLERWPACVAARVAPDEARWVLADATGAVPLHGEAGALPVLVAVAASGPAAVAGELSADGFLPLAVHLDGRTVPL